MCFQTISHSLLHYRLTQRNSVVSVITYAVNCAGWATDSGHSQAAMLNGCDSTILQLFLIIYANVCCVFSARWWSVMPWGARSPIEIEQGFFSGFPRMQSGMFVIFSNTIFNYCNFNIYVYIFTCGPYIQIYLVWPFMPKNQNFNHSFFFNFTVSPCIFYIDLICTNVCTCIYEYNIT